ncbi:MAG TPA: hypothetical protein VGE98_16025 [Thermoanaerobaculia bacterium]
MQTDLLAAHPQLDLRVYAIWLPLLRGDSREAWEAGPLVDARMGHYWDEGREIGDWFLKNVTHRKDETEWDSYFFYPAGARLGPTTAASWGRPVYEVREQLGRAVRTPLRP